MKIFVIGMVSATLTHEHGSIFNLGFESEVPYSEYGKRSIAHFRIRNWLGKYFKYLCILSFLTFEKY